MAKPTAGTGFALTLERTLAASPERVFEAFTQAEKLSRWFSPGDDYQCVVHLLEARAGGRYRITMRRPDGYESVAFGTYEEVSRPHRLVFSWTWEDKPEHLTSRVIVNLEPRGAGTSSSPPSSRAKRTRRAGPAASSGSSATSDPRRPRGAGDRRPPSRAVLGLPAGVGCQGAEHLRPER